MPKITKIESTVPTITKRKRVAAYARVSMEADRSLHSLSAQISYYNDFIQGNPDWEFVGIYVDRGISGTGTAKREEFQRLIADSEKGLIDKILCKSISRFARNTVDLLETVRKLKLLGVEVIFEKEGVNSMSADGEVMLSILASFAQEESRSISDNCKWAIRSKYKEGVSRASLIYGYKKIKDGFEIVPEQAKIVEHIFTEFLTGKSCYVIANELNEQNIPSYYNKKWSNTSILRMLRQEKYLGDSLLQKFFVDDCLTHKMTRNEGQLPKFYAENTHPAIIDKDLFEQVQLEFVKRYGVDMEFGIAVTDSREKRYEKHQENLGDRPRRLSIWSEEKKQEISERFKNRETAQWLKHELSCFLKCEECNENLTAQVRVYADGSRGLKWICRNHYKVSSKDTKPPYMSDISLKNTIAVVLGLDEFDEQTMVEILNHIIVRYDMLIFSFKDGREETRQYREVKRQYRRKKVQDDGTEKSDGDSSHSKSEQSEPK